MKAFQFFCVSCDEDDAIIFTKDVQTEIFAISSRKHNRIPSAESVVSIYCNQLQLFESARATIFIRACHVLSVSYMYATSPFHRRF
jgi:hypothetical protein